VKLPAKQMSVEHERHLARAFRGRAEPASGAVAERPGDVFCRDDETLLAYGQPLLIEGKTSESASLAVNRAKFEKTMAEAAQRGARPYWSLRFRDPYTGEHLDLVVKLEDDELADQAELAGRRK